jgi:hypothetical protein
LDLIGSLSFSMTEFSVSGDGLRVKEGGILNIFRALMNSGLWKQEFCKKNVSLLSFE